VLIAIQIAIEVVIGSIIEACAAQDKKVFASSRSHHYDEDGQKAGRWKKGVADFVFALKVESKLFGKLGRCDYSSYIHHLITSHQT